MKIKTLSVFIFISLCSICYAHSSDNKNDSYKWKHAYQEAKQYFDKREINKSITLAKEADSIYSIYNNKPYSSAHSLLAICYKDLGNWISAHKYYQSALACETNPVAKVIIALNMAELGTEAGDTMMAINQFVNNFEFVKNHFSPKEKAYCYHSFANILMQTKYHCPFIKITQLYDSAFCIYAKEARYEGAGFTALNFSNYYASINNTDSVSYWVHKAYEMQLKANTPLGMADALLGLAKYHLNYASKDSALHYYKKALYYSQNSHYVPFLEDDYKGLATVYEQLHQYDLSSKYYKLYYSLKDSLQREKWRIELSKMQIEFDIKTKNKKIKDLASSLSASKYKHTILTALAILFIIAISTFSIKKNNKQLSALNKNKRKAVKPLRKHFSAEKLKIWNTLELLIKNDKIYLKQDITLSSLAKKLNTNRSTLSEIINEKSGKTFNQFINQYRIEEAARLLKDTKMMHLTIEGIAQETGFKSRSSFYTAFISEKGITPSSYRKQENKGVAV